VLETLLQANDTQERCGLVLRDGSTVEITNVAKDPVISFEMDPVEVLPYLTEDQVAGTWHTHPQSDPHLSGEDYSGFLGWPDLKHHVIGVTNGKTVVKTYEVKNGAVVECA
jgi:proteasome lid subunit RPN8/RPN11